MRPTLSLAGALIALIGACYASNDARGELRLASVFSSHGVLQRGRPLPIWGWGDEGATVRVSFLGKSVETRVQGGRWRVELPAQRAGGPYELTAQSGSETVTLTNLLVGEVWVASGQSNMEWPLNRTENPAGAIAQSANDRIRLYTVPKRKAEAPVDRIDAQWKVCGPDSVAGFSAVAYYFGRDLEKALGVPIGLIHTSWGGSPAEAWTSEPTLAAHPEFKKDILDPYPVRKRAYDESVAAWEKESAELKAAGKEQKRGRPWPGWRPSELYNGMIHPLLPYAIAGAIWYQGESNAGQADQYSRLYPAMIRDWRAAWGQGDFPFLGVQLAPWDANRKRSLAEITTKPVDSSWAELREAQWMATKVLPKVGMAVITDAGDKDDIHPQKKEPVGARLALQARAIAYKERLVSTGPLFRSMRVRRGAVTLTFDSVGSGLEARGGALSGFQICGADRQWVWAEAAIEGSRVVVSHPDVKEPVAVRYGWSDFPVVNLFNREGLPASPFRTDNFPLTTARKP